ncbi:MAG: type II secretion system minor pseudopilin GspK [Gammaproteobacteria bacterium]|nr:type II secretion system minor pseudopilin GspK [Gammaproteobacteria bacterium]
MSVSPYKNKGSALIVALFVFSLSVIVATAMTNSQSLHIRRAANILDGDQAYLYALSLEENVKFTLLEDIQSKKREQTEQSEVPVDHLQEAWAQKIDTTDDATGTKAELLAIVTDAQSCLNVNAIVDANVGQEYRARFKQLLQMNGIEENDSITSALIDWIDENHDPVTGGAEDREYMDQKSGYRTGNQPMNHPSELRLVRGVSHSLFKKIGPIICTLPETPTKININTASVPVLRILAPNISKEDAEALVAGRTQEKEGGKQQKAYESTAKFLEHTVFKTASSKKPNENLLSVNSSYFFVDATAKIGRGKAHLVSLLKRDKDNIRVIWRSWGE